jgi:hypothetical protein
MLAATERSSCGNSHLDEELFVGRLRYARPVKAVPIAFPILCVVFTACGVLLLVFRKKILLRGKNWQIYSMIQHRNLKIATTGNVLVVTAYCFLFGLAFLVALIDALITG